MLWQVMVMIGIGGGEDVLCRIDALSRVHRSDLTSLALLSLTPQVAVY